MKIAQRKIEWPKMTVIAKTKKPVLDLECGHKIDAGKTHPSSQKNVGEQVECLDCFLNSEKGAELLNEFVVRYG